MTTAPDRRLGNPDWTDNWTLGLGLRLEIMDTATSDVWLCQDPLDREIARGLNLPDGFAFLAVGEAVADEAYFDRSPDADADGPVEVMEVGGLRFSRVARPVGQETIGPLTVLTVHKHHTMRYAAGRTIPVLDRGNGAVLIPAWRGSDPSEPRLPEGWSLLSVELAADLVAQIPDPATVAVVNGSGFHGPVAREAIDEVTR